MASKRNWHLLRHNKNTETVHQAIWFDTETKKRFETPTKHTHHLWFGWACYRKVNRHGNWSRPEWYRFETTEEFWRWVVSKLRPRTRLWLFCHNTNFDLPVLHTLRELPRLGFYVTEAIIDGPPTVISYLRCIAGCEATKDVRGTYRPPCCDHPKQTVRIMDTLNIWRMPLKEIGRKLSIEKLEMPPETADNAAWDTYGKRDTEIIMQATINWLEWLKDNDMGGFAATLAAQSMRAYRHRFMDHPILIDGHTEALELARSAYHGGRVECGRIGTFEGRFFLLDINSMYPHVMRTYEMPTKLRGYLTRCDGLDIRGYLRNHCCVAEVTLQTKVPFAAIVDDGKLIFPTGRFQAYLTSPEIHYALEIGALEKIHRVAVYEKALLFRRFVDEMYQRRTECIERGDTVGEWHFKKLLNSFYGKWGQNGRKWKTIGMCDPELMDVEDGIDAQTLKGCKVRYFGGCVQQLQMEAESFESHPAIAAHITAHARLELFEIILQAGIENYLYCDTDAVLVTIEGFQRLEERIDRVGLGKLKQVGEYRHVIINGPKDYSLDGKQTLKGIRPSARQIDLNTYEQERWSSLKGLIREGSIDAPVTRTVTKTLRRVYNKGIVLSSGHVQPFVFPRE